MTKLATFSSTGTKSSTKTNMPAKWMQDNNPTLLAQALRVYENHLHPGVSKTKTRGEIKLSTRKIYRQKGTGMARHGAKSAPIFVGGSKAHGPDGLKRTLKLPKKMRAKALGIALSQKADESKLIVVNGIEKVSKTKSASKLISKIIKNPSKNNNSRVTVVLSDNNKSAKRAFRNIFNVVLLGEKSLNAHSVYYGGFIILDNKVLEDQSKSSSKKKETNKSKK